MICVAGWYYEPTWMAQLYALSYKYPVAVIAHKPPPECFPFHTHVLLPNIGLEFHCYDYFLKRIWTGEKVLFCQDDIRCAGPLEPIVDWFFSSEADHASVFQDEEDILFNEGVHGRMFLCSPLLLSLLLEEGGFPYDPNNTGQVYQGEGVEYNLGVNAFKRFLIRMKEEKGLRVGEGFLVPQLTLARRGVYDYPKVGREGRIEWLQSLSPCSA